MHEDRIKKELQAAGVTAYGMKKFAIKYMPKIIHENEHIHGIIYGRYNDKSGMPLNEGVLVATNLRIVFIDHKPGYTNTDELTYDVVAGISRTSTLFSAVSLRTRLGEYKFRYVNTKCAAKFVDYVEHRRLESSPKT